MEQRKQLARVTCAIGRAVLDFARSRVGQEFHANDLRAYVDMASGPTAPGSADRVMRDMRRRGVLDYTLISRGQSLYRIDRAS